MKIIDMTHVMNVHTPGWVGYAGNKMYYAQNLQTQMIVAQRIDTALHVGTLFDGAMHATDNRADAQSPRRDRRLPVALRGPGRRAHAGSWRSCIAGRRWRRSGRRRGRSWVFSYHLETIFEHIRVHESRKGRWSTAKKSQSIFTRRLEKSSGVSSTMAGRGSASVGRAQLGAVLNQPRNGYLQTKSVWINNGPGGSSPFIMKTAS